MVDANRSGTFVLVGSVVLGLALVAGVMAHKTYTIEEPDPTQSGHEQVDSRGLRASDGA